jgi:hypothetical protein
MQCGAWDAYVVFGISMWCLGCVCSVWHAVCGAWDAYVVFGISIDNIWVLALAVLLRAPVVLLRVPVSTVIDLMLIYDFIAL